ncbi:hypothetical protein SMALB_5057 [Streptomyces malaysiensis]|uniref:Uncharacterized protein n=1 Tax=Streptomyces malaysiensis TaxID=92644 RepID=A0A7X5X5I0_STRMQ|nr:hypothetical protein [Streptomyces malaysiensis]NIY67019.1 hypothetical protein [Streptomyces malaysiensis]
MAVTTTGTVPGGWGGVVTVIWLSESMVGTTAVVPKRTVWVVARPVPVMVTVVPPAVGPEPGVRLPM